jgi:hypothetical protein
MLSAAKMVCQGTLVDAPVRVNERQRGLTFNPSTEPLQGLAALAKDALELAGLRRIGQSRLRRNNGNLQ